MYDARRTALVAITAIVVLGTAYSVLYDSYLDTSNPLLAQLPHPLGSTHYFASKQNPLNVYFIKKAWGWTSAAFFLSWFTSPSCVRTKERILQWILATATWLVFTGWFFGPPLFERVTVASGGQCLINLPTGEHVDVPFSLCYSKSTVTPATHPELFASPAFASLSSHIDAIPSEWHVRPRLRNGHDISGHIFLLTMSILFLVDQLRASFYTRRDRNHGWPLLHYVATAANVVLIAIWLFASYTTSIYFHSPLEKITGFVLGVACFGLTQLPLVKLRLQERKLHTN
ncbi:hypothetical protein AX17_004554 [Amanita inopinata Kibby_2008]|nr:hypothetical protein AX17_004554 [Amanita inopinata Kibby_2008]